jgi:hypothetical protein
MAVIDMQRGMNWVKVVNANFKWLMADFGESGITDEI